MIDVLFNYEKDEIAVETEGEIMLVIHTQAFSSDDYCIYMNELNERLQNRDNLLDYARIEELKELNEIKEKD